jgi:hypothetical protein
MRLITLWSGQLACASELSEKPTASPFARLQAKHDEPTVTLHHVTVRLAEGHGRTLLQLLDGTRDRAQLLSALREHSGTATDELNEASLEASLTGLLARGFLVS